MALSLDLQNTENVGDPLASGGVQPGRGLVLVQSFGEFADDKTNSHVLELEAIAWTDVDSVGKIHRELIFTSSTFKGGGPEDKLLMLAYATGLVTRKEMVKAKESGSMPEIEFTDAVGRPMFVILESRKAKESEKTYTNVANFGKAYYHSKDPACKDWPTNTGVILSAAKFIGEFDPPVKASVRYQQGGLSPSGNGGVVNPFASST